MSRHAIDISTDADRQKAAHWCGKAPKGMRIEFRTPTRSVEQNKMMWALINELREAMAARGRVHTAEHWKIILLHACGKELSLLPSLDGATVIPYGQSSSELTIKEMTDLIEFIMAWGAENGIQFKDPGASSPSAQPVDGAEASPPASAPSSITKSVRVHLTDFARKGFSTLKKIWPDAMKETALSDMLRSYSREIKKHGKHGDVLTLEVVHRAILDCFIGKRTEEQAIEFISRELGCTAQELKGIR